MNRLTRCSDGDGWALQTRRNNVAIDESPSISLRDLYYTLGRNTSGSHVKVYNDHNYGSVYSETMGEYLR